MTDSVDSSLKHEENELIKDKEIERILGCFRLDYYSILDSQPGITKNEINKIYRKKSLLIHPDKTKNPKAVDAFDILRKAAEGLGDDKSRSELDESWSDARRELIRQKKWTIDDDRLGRAEFLKEWRSKVKEVLIEEEFAKRVALKREQAEEGRKRKMEDEVKEERKRQKEKDDSWEKKRDDRVEKWRKFKKKGKKRKKGVLI